MMALAPRVVVVEATGGYERAIVAALAAAQVPIAVVNPRQVRAYAQAVGRDRENRSDRCRRAGGVWRAHATGPASARGCRDAGARGVGHPAAAIARDARDGTQTLGAGAADRAGDA